MAALGADGEVAAAQEAALRVVKEAFDKHYVRRPAPRAPLAP